MRTFALTLGALALRLASAHEYPNCVCLLAFESLVTAATNSPRRSRTTATAT